MTRASKSFFRKPRVGHRQNDKTYGKRRQHLKNPCTAALQTIPPPFRTAIGLFLVIAAIRPLTDILPSGVNPWDPVLFLVVGFLLLATGAGAAYLPARFAANIDPSLALREE